MSMTMLVLVARATSTTNENIEAVKKIILKDFGCWWCWHIVRPLISNFYGCFRHETCGSKDCSKIAKFSAGDVDDVQLRSRFAEKDYKWWRIMGVWLWHWNKSPIILKGVSRRAKILKSWVKCEALAHCFLRMLWHGASWILATRSYGQ